MDRSTHSSLRIFLPAALAALLLSACGSTTAATECETNLECGMEEQCISGLCQPAVCEPACGADAECRHGSCACLSDDACALGEACDDGQCVPGTPPECTETSGCADGFTCAEGQCVCATDVSCGPGLVCDDGACREATACDADAECADEGRVCTYGECVQPCASASDCGSVEIFWACQAGHCLARCFVDTDCNAGLICERVGQDNVCVEAECTTLTDCDGDHPLCTSANHGRCLDAPPCDDDRDCEWDHTCRMPQPCPPGFDCSEGNEVCLPRDPCNTDLDCAGESNETYCDRGYCFDALPCDGRDECEEGRDCIGGACVPFACRGEADCEAGELCSGGVCVTPDPAPTADRVDILTPDGHLLEGEERQLIAVAYDNTDRVIVGAEFAWASSNPDAVAVDPGTGLLIGGDTPGVATITATYGGETGTATWRLLAPVEGDDLRVTVVDREDGRPVADAVVRLGELEETTDADGVAVFEVTEEGAVDVHVFAETHDYVSVFSASGRDLLIPLPRQSDPNRAAGVTGSVSYDNVSTEGDAAIGLAGASLGGALPDFDMVRLMGEVFVITVQGNAIPLPGALTTELTFWGQRFNLKGTYYAPGEEGLRMGWAFAGRIDFTSFNTGGSAGTRLANLLPMFSLFEHGLHPRISLADRDKIQDTADINGNGDTTEMVPDWNNFPQRNHAPAQTQNLRVFVEPGDLPELDGDRLDTVILMTGARAPRIGLVPLGLSATDGVNDDGQTLDKAPGVRMRMAPIYGGLEVGAYQVIALAVPETEGFDAPREASARVLTSSELPVDVVFDDFLAFPEDTTWNGASRTIDHASVPGAHLVRTVVQGSERAWHVYAPNPESGSVSWQLPAVPAGVDDLEDPDSARISPIELAVPFTFEDLLHLGGAGLIDLDTVTAAYSRMVK
jgi:hypothetical protein